MKTKATLRYLRMSPRKVRLLIDLVRGARVKDAMVQLRFSKKIGAKPVMKLLQSAMANAVHNHGLADESLVVREAFVDGGPILYRATPRAMGRSAPIRKRTAHVTVVLEGEVAEKNTGKKKEKEPTAAEKEKTDAPDKTQET